MIDYVKLLKSLCKSRNGKILDIYMQYDFPGSTVLQKILGKQYKFKKIPGDLISACIIHDNDIITSIYDFIIENISVTHGKDFAHKYASEIYSPDLDTPGIPGLKMSNNLNYEAFHGRLDPVIGREKEIDELITILNNRRKKNPVLIGDAGVGKTAIVEGLAQRINNKQVPINMLKSTIFTMNITQFIEMENGLNIFYAVLNYLASFENVIIFIDEFHQISDARRRTGISLIDVLKPILARGQIRLIAATTEEEYRKIEKDKAMARRMQPIYVKETNENETMEILNKIYPTYSSYHNVSISENALKMIYRASINVSGFNPDKSLSILDSVLARGKVVNNGIKYSMSDDEVANFIQVRYNVKRAFIINDNVDSAISERIKTELPIYSDVADNIAKQLLIAHSKSNKSNNVSSVITIITNPNRKSTNRIAKSLAKILDPQEKYIMIDGSEFSSEISITRIIGAPPAYIGYDSSTLFYPISHRPMPVIISNIHKMHFKCRDIIIKAISDGYIDTSSGDRIILRNVDFIITLDASSTGILFGEKNISIDNAIETISDIIIQARYVTNGLEAILDKYNKKETNISNYINDSYTIPEIENILQNEQSNDTVYIK